ncbi:hypothetical protein N7931_11775 [Catenovulum sp. 2E275]|uniref:hypothetical protein n=1 Tax=Catenovulum sp. 2E275 TaxID=2980497 RepID=UPI0021D0EADB|nr:hypothetical protein [Catenovulum sp. 2E275]MCU4676305.1 hypothetical protein [Catenovulum sp. 2E275]
MQNLIDTIRQNIVQARIQAIECDKILEALKQQGKGKFSTIFSDGFVTRSSQFVPYVDEVASDFYDLIDKGQTEIPQQSVVQLVKQLEMIFTTQAKFMDAISEQDQPLH